MDRHHAPTPSRFSFPRQINETSARLVASGVVAQGLAFLVIRQWWVLVPLTYGFLARVVAGPTFSPLAQFVTRVVTPRVAGEHRIVPGPPKRFAQGVGLAFSGSALVAVALGGPTVAAVLIVALVMAAALEAFVGVCLGCVAFAQFIAWGVIPSSVCEECSNLGERLDLVTQRG